MQWRLIEVASFGEGPKGELSFLHCTHSLRRGKLPTGCDDDDDDKESWASTNYVLMMVIAVVQLRRISHAGLDELLSALFVSSKKFSLIFVFFSRFKVFYSLCITNGHFIVVSAATRASIKLLPRFLHRWREWRASEKWPSLLLSLTIMSEYSTS